MAAQVPPLPPQRSKAVIDFLVKVSTDPALKAAYGEDADAAMTAAGLSQRERELVLSGDLNRIRQAFGASVSRIVWQPPTVWQ